MIVVADTTPVNYLILIEQIEVLQELYGRVIIPPAVLNELQSRDTPEAVKEWIADRPQWLEIQQVRIAPDAALKKLGAGESEAITLAQQLQADALIIDDRDGRREARQRNLRVIGTLRVLSEAAERGRLDLTQTVKRLQETSFRASAKLLQSFLDEDAKRER